MLFAFHDRGLAIRTRDFQLTLWLSASVAKDHIALIFLSRTVPFAHFISYSSAFF